MKAMGTHGANVLTLHEISQNQLDVSGAVSTQVSFVESFCIYCFLLLFIVHSFYFSDQYTIVENKGALDVISKTLR